MKLRIEVNRQEQQAIARKLDALVVEIDKVVELGAGARAGLARIRALVLGEAPPRPRRATTWAQKIGRARRKR